jgi:single-stranded-DNA-specific exonuclease
MKQPKRWKLLPEVPPVIASKENGFSSLLAQLLFNRGLTSSSQFKSFLSTDGSLLNNPFLLLEMDKAVDRIFRALRDKELIAIYGDFDADGVTATATLTQGLAILGGKVIPYVPHRVEEGHGLNYAALKKLQKQGVTLVITVDCGISFSAEIEQAQKNGLDIIVTDHHKVPSIPPAVAVVDPKREDSKYPFRDLAGVGVAFKLLQALLAETGKEERLEEFLDLVAVGTVVDMMPLVGENRLLVKRGLEVLNATRRLGFREIVSQARLNKNKLSSEDLSFIIGPRLNAPGRVGYATASYQLLVTESPEEARILASELEARNSERKRLTSQVLEVAREKLPSEEMPLLMVGDEDFPAGIVGLVASNLVEEFYRPAVVIHLGEEISRGSARSIPEFSIINALSKCQDLFIRFGGHDRAAGFTLPTSNLEILQQKLMKMAESELSDVDLHPTITIDAEIPLSSLNWEVFRLIESLGPFGEGNPTPIFLSRHVKVVNHHILGKSGEHLKLKLQDSNNVTWDGMAFGLGGQKENLSHYIDVVYNLTSDAWSGTELLCLNILDFRS